MAANSIKSQFQNPKSQTNSNFKIQISKFLCFGHLNFDIIWDLDIGILDLLTVHNLKTTRTLLNPVPLFYFGISFLLYQFYLILGFFAKFNQFFFG